MKTTSKCPSHSNAWSGSQDDKHQHKEQSQTLKHVDNVYEGTESSIYKGTVFHRRSVPKVHQFDYHIYLFWLKLEELDKVSNTVKGFNVDQAGLKWVNFKREDYLGDKQKPLEDSVLSRMSELAGKTLSGTVYLLGQVRTLGMYFSPVNFYFLKNDQNEFTYMLAEVSNTPWNNRHHYLVNMNKQNDNKKAFHVSPFNPMDMVYKWQIAPPSETLNLHLSCYKQTKHFEAALKLRRIPLSTKSLRQVVLSIPSMTIKTVLGIYWQALKLFFKRVPIHAHPESQNK